MKLRTATARIALAAVLAAAHVHAQETPEPQVDERVQVLLVQMALRAHDGRGAAITDLTPDDLVVKDRGRKLRIAFLESQTASGGEALDARLYVAVPESSQEPSASSGVPARYLIVMVDVESDYRLLRPEAAQQFIEYLKPQLAEGLQTAIVSYDGRIHLEQAFSSDAERLSQAVLRAYDRPPRPNIDLQARMRNLMRDFEQCAPEGGGTRPQGDESCLEGVLLEYADEVRPRAEEYFQALEELVLFAGGMQTPASLLVLGHGLAADPTLEAMEAMEAIYGNTDQVSRLRLTIVGEGAAVKMDGVMELALANRVSLSFVDRSPAPAGEYSARTGAAYQPTARPIQDAFLAPQADLRQMAGVTGGVYVHDVDFASGLRRAGELERGAYLLGYYADRPLSAKQLGKVKVNATRKGVRLTYRRGYFARPNPAPRDGASLVLGVPLALEEEDRAGQFVPFTIVADPEAIGYEVDEEAARANFTVLCRLEGSNGRSVVESYHLLQHAYPADVWLAEAYEPIQFPGWIEAPPGTYRLALYVRNTLTGVTLEATQPLTVPE